MENCNKGGQWSWEKGIFLAFKKSQHFKNNSNTWKISSNKSGVLSNYFPVKCSLEKRENFGIIYFRELKIFDT